MLDQAQKLRQLALNKNADEEVDDKNKNTSKIVTITSGKGGVGKSNIVVNLAIELQRIGNKVLIFDADIGMGNDDILMGVLSKYTVFDIVFNNMEIDDILIEGPFGVKLLPGGTGISRVDELTKEQRDSFFKKINALKGFDYIVMDTGAGMNRTVLGFAAACEELVIVTTPEPTALTDAYSLMKAIDKFHIKPSANVIINRAISVREAEITYNKFKNAVNRFLSVDINYLGKVSEDRFLTQSVREQKPFVLRYPSSDASRDIRDIALKLTGIESKNKSLGVQGLFKKIFNIFS